MGPQLEPTDRAVNPVVGVILLVAITVICSAAFGTFVIGLGSDLESASNPKATVQIDNIVRDDTDGFVTLVVHSMSNADSVAVTATTSDGSSTIDDGTPTGTAELTERRHATGDSITFRKEVDPSNPRDVELRLVAVAENDDDEARIYDRTVTI